MGEINKADFSSSNKDIDEHEEGQPKRNTSKIYFFVLAITALLATNTYFYFKYKTTVNQSYELGSEKTLMEEEINQIEAELNLLTSKNVEINGVLKATQDSVRNLIQQLRSELQQKDLNQEKLAKAQQEIHKLRQEVREYRIGLSEQTSEYTKLEDEKNRLEQKILEKDKLLTQLVDSNTSLNDQIKSAAIIKVSKINILGLRSKNGGKTESESKAKRVDRIRINFTIVENPLVPKGKLNVFLRIIDPSGNLNTNTDQFFELNGTAMQYTTKTEIEFTNLGEEYSIDWVDSTKFKKGIYTVLLYTEQSTMGRASIVLN